MNIQSAITKRTCAILSVADSLIKVGEKHDKEIRNCLDAIYLLGHANTAMSMQKRELLRPALKSDYAGLCDSSTPVTSLLFGDDPPKSLKQSRQMVKCWSWLSVNKRETIRVSSETQERIFPKEDPQQEIQGKIDTKESSFKEPYSEVRLHEKFEFCSVEFSEYIYKIVSNAENQIVHFEGGRINSHSPEMVPIIKYCCR